MIAYPSGAYALRPLQMQFLPGVLQGASVETIHQMPKMTICQCAVWPTGQHGCPHDLSKFDRWRKSFINNLFLWLLFELNQISTKKSHSTPILI